MPQVDSTPETQGSPAAVVPPPPPPGATGAGFAAGEPEENPRLAVQGGVPQGDEPTPRSPWLWLAILLLLGVALPFVPIPNIWLAGIGALVLTIGYVFVVVRFASDATRYRLPVLKHAALFALAVALWWIFDNYIGQQAVAPLRDANAAARAANLPRPTHPASILFPVILTRTLTDIFLLSSAVLGGALVARLITEPSMLAPICGLIAMIDIWGVLFGGIVAQLIAKAPNVSARAMASMPTIGAAAGPASKYSIPLPDIGAGDYLFLGVLFAAMHAHRMNVRGAQRWIIPLVILALCGVTLGLPAMPGLLFIGLGAAIPNRAWFSFTRDEKFALMWAGGFVLALSIALGFAAPHIVGAAQKMEPAGNNKMTPTQAPR